MRESSIEGWARRLARANGAYLVKITRVIGWPDRVLLVPQRPAVLAEFKRSGLSTLRPAQAATRRQLEAQGFVVHTINSKRAFAALLANTLGVGVDDLHKSR